MTVAFNDGRCIRFSGLVGGQRSRAAVDAVLAAEPLPDGFEFDTQRMWWEGLSEAQRAYVQSRITTGLARLVCEATAGSEASEAIINAGTIDGKPVSTAIFNCFLPHNPQKPA